MSLLVMFFGFWSCLVYFENCEIFEIKVRDEFTLKRNSYTYIYIYIFTASVVKRARMLINSIGSSWEGFGWTIGTILVLVWFKRKMTDSAFFRDHLLSNDFIPVISSGFYFSK